MGPKLSGVIVCSGRIFGNNDHFRMVARKICDRYFPAESGLDSDIKGTVYRYQDESQIEVENTYLTWKERLWGEWVKLPLEFEALVVYFSNGFDVGLVTYRDLTDKQLQFLLKVLRQMKLRPELPEELKDLKPEYTFDFGGTSFQFML